MRTSLQTYVSLSPGWNGGIRRSNLRVPAFAFSVLAYIAVGCGDRPGAGGFAVGHVPDVPVRSFAHSAPVWTSRACVPVVVCTVNCSFCRALASNEGGKWDWIIVAPRKQAREFATEHGIPLRRLSWMHATDETAALHSLNLNTTPTTVLVDVRGVVRDIRIGAPDYTTVERDSMCASEVQTMEQ